MFIVDSQTQSDLGIFPQSKYARSILGIFNEVSSYEGRYHLEKMFRNPLSDKKEIADRIELLRFLENNELDFKINKEVLDFIEHYLSLVRVPSRYSYIDGLRKSWAHKFKVNNEYYIINRAISWFIELINELYLFAQKVLDSDSPALAFKFSARIINIVEQSEFTQFRGHNGKKLSSYEIEKLDHQIRYLRKPLTRELLDIIYQIDVYIAVIKAKIKYGFVLPDIEEEVIVDIKGLYHPFIENAVANDFSIDSQNNFSFITGANMAGKSTFMRSFSIAVYLAHMGFPVPAQQMRFSVFDGLFTTINVPDDINLGYSHFYAEVNRIKSIAERFRDSSRYIILFDELFRGTNVKDAFDATVAVIKAFSEIKSSLFIFSSHIIEAAEKLKDENINIKFQNFQSAIEDNNLKYTYKIKDAICNDRFGMYIIEREGILQKLKESGNR